MGNASGRVFVNVQAQNILAAGVAAGAIPLSFQAQLELANGTAAGSIDLAYGKTESSIAASTITSYDLSGSLTDAVGAAVVFARVSLIAIRNNRTTALAYLDMGPHATNGFGRLGTPTAGFGFWPADIAADADQGSIVAPGSWVVLHALAGVPLTNAASDILRVTTSAVVGATNGWDLLILGTSA